MNPGFYTDDGGRLQRDDATPLPERVPEKMEYDEALRKLGRNVPDEPTPERSRDVYHNVDSAYKEVQERKETQRAQAEERTKAESWAKERVDRYKVKAAGTLNAEDQAVVARATQRYQAIEYVEQQKARAAELVRQNPQAAPQMQQYLASLEQQIAPHRQQLAAELHHVRGLQQSKQQARGLAELEQIDSDLAQPDARERLVKYLVKNGISESRARSERDPTVIGLAWKQMRAEEQKAHDAEIQAEVARRSRGRNLNPLHPRYETSAEAFAGLRTRGNLRDGMEYLTMKRDERALRGKR
jgi:hypothetical protein